MPLMEQVEQHSMWEELNTLQNTAAQPGHVVLNFKLINLNTYKQISEDVPISVTQKLKQACTARVQALLTKPICPSGLVAFGYTVLPQNAVWMHFCRMRAQQEGAKITRVKGQKSEISPE